MFTTDGRGALNADWHSNHKMPRNPTLDQRIAWHRQHAQHCSCRPLPESIKAEIEKRARAART